MELSPCSGCQGLVRLHTGGQAQGRMRSLGTANAAKPSLPLTASPLLPPGWHYARDPATGKFYFYNTSTGVVQWEPPGISAAAGGDAVAAGDAAQQAPSILASAIPHIQPSLAGVLAAAVQLPTSMGSVAGLVPAGMTEDEMLQMAINASLRANGV